MSLPHELSTVCFQLLNTPSPALVQSLPELLRQVQRCQDPLSCSLETSTQGTAPAAVLVHKLKTVLSTFLNGRVPEQRFIAAVLIKAVVEVGGWEILRGCEAWVRGLLSVLAKSDCAATKEICVVTLCKIYKLTHPYQTLVREITTPTLPTFITTCLNLVDGKSSSKTWVAPTSLVEAVFRTFGSLLPRHTTIYRPFVSRLRVVLKPYLAPTLEDSFAPSSLKDSARRLQVLLHLTVAKNAGGEEWGKAVRDLVKQIHVTADLVFRAVVEDWESDAGYHGELVDVSKALCGGGGDDIDSFPRWTGIVSGIQRLTGLVALLDQYIQSETSTPVSVPLGLLIDLVTRIMFIRIPGFSKSASYEETRLRPAIDRDERDGLWSGMTQIYVAALKLVASISGRLQEAFMVVAQGFLQQLVFLFPIGKHDPTFRTITFVVVARVLALVGPSLDRDQGSKLSLLCRACCEDVYPLILNHVDDSPRSSDDKLNSNGKRPRSIHNADNLLDSSPGSRINYVKDNDALIIAANTLLPLLISHIPQTYLHVSVRSLLDQTAILASHKDAMLASILHPYTTNNGRTLASILPHITREFPTDVTVELLLRPRMPVVPSTATPYDPEAGAMAELEDDDMEIEHTAQAEFSATVSTVSTAPGEHTDHSPGFGGVSGMSSKPANRDFLSQGSLSNLIESTLSPTIPLAPTSLQPYAGPQDADDDASSESDLDLVMQIDSDSE